MRVDEKQGGARHHQAERRMARGPWPTKAKGRAGCWPLKIRAACAHPQATAAGAKCWARCGRMCVAPGVSVQRHATQKESQSHQPKQMVQIPSLCQRGSTWSDHPHDVAEAGRSRAPCGGGAGRRSGVSCVWRRWVYRPRNQDWPRAKWGAKNEHAPPPAKKERRRRLCSVAARGQGRAEGGVWCCKAKAKTKGNPQTRPDKGKDKEETKTTAQTGGQGQNVPMWREGDVDARPSRVWLEPMTRQRCGSGPLKDFVCAGTNALLAEHALV